MSACAGRFERSTWIIQPNIDPLNQVAAHVDVIVFDESNTASESRVQAKVCNFLNEAFPGFIFRVRFACVDDLDWSLCIVEQSADTLQIIEQQIRSVIGCKATAETDGQDVRA